MITSWEELGEALAEIENRLSYLEMNQNNTQVSNLEERILNLEQLLESFKIPEWTRQQWDIVDQLRNKTLYLQNKVNEVLEALKLGRNG